eukprot:TRINITY_DN5795_c1_g7_i1.p1 TRINITY_DN5795_c1_g7~~TRINITY_DN5795_c1_g7_i1.p1  ORF type:complete len:161 (+),score=56.03 TRINITY_DN5795_c1_g7_i1:86-568(+)
MAPTKSNARLLAFTGCAAACFFAANAFVTGGAANNAALRGKEVRYGRFEQAPLQVEMEQPQAWSSAVAAVAAFALVAGLVSPAAKAAPMSSARSTTVVAVSESSMNLAMKQFVNPSEELDADEQPFEDWSAEHPVQLILTGLIPVFIYLTFYILGSLEVI